MPNANPYSEMTLLDLSVDTFLLTRGYVRPVSKNPARLGDCVSGIYFCEEGNRQFTSVLIPEEIAELEAFAEKVRQRLIADFYEKQEMDIPRLEMCGEGIDIEDVEGVQ